MGELAVVVFEGLIPEGLPFPFLKATGIECPAGSTMEDQAWDAEVPELPQATCLVEVLEECERAVAGEEIYQVAGDGGHAVRRK